MKTFAVIGLGTFGMALARSLARLGAQVTAVDTARSHLEGVKDEVHTAIRMDARDRDALEEQGIHELDCAVVCMGEDFEAAEICAVHLTELGCRSVRVRGTTRERAAILDALGPEVITPGIDAAREYAVRLLAPGAVDYASLKGDHDVGIFRIPEHVAGETLESLRLDRHRVHVMAIRRGADIYPGPGGSQDLLSGDHLILIGAEKDLLKAAEAFAEA